MEERSYWYWVFVAPGKALVKFDYLFPAKGRVHITARHLHSRPIHVINSIAFWLILIGGGSFAIYASFFAKPTPSYTAAPLSPGTRPTLPPAPPPPPGAPIQPTPSAALLQVPSPPASARELDNALARLRAQRQQSGATGAPTPSPTSQGTDNAHLSAAARIAIGDRIRECWTGDMAPPKSEGQSARVQVTTDAYGVIRDARIVQVGSGTSGRAFADRVLRAALSSQCAQLPLPKDMLGASRTFEITFRP